MNIEILGAIRNEGCYLFSFFIIEAPTGSSFTPQQEAAMTTTNALFSTMVRAGRTTYFIDVKEAKNGNRYISIAENRVDGEEKKRTTVRVFGESIDPFRQAIDEAAAAVAS